MVFIEHFQGFPYFIREKNGKDDFRDSLISLWSLEKITRNGRVTYEKRYYQICGTLTELDLFLLRYKEMYSHDTVIGRIVVKEFLESSVPEIYKAQLDQNKPWEEAIKNKLLQDYNTNSYLTFNGERILRFVDYDSTGEEKDVIIENTDIASNNKTITSIPSVESLNVQNTSKTVSENTVTKTNLSPTLNTVTVPLPQVKSNSGQTNDNNSNQQRTSHTTSNVLSVIALIIIIFFAFKFKSITMIVVGVAIVGFFSFMIGGIIKELLAPSSSWSVLLYIIIGIVAIIVFGSAFDGCGVSEPDSGWSRP
jgi:hypothetical protein